MFRSALVPRAVQVAALAIAAGVLLTGCRSGGERLAAAGENLAPGAAPAGTRAPTWEGMFSDVDDGVGRISVVRCDGSGTGSGFLVAADLMLTAAHVVADATSVSVRLGTEVRSADVVGIDPAIDLALIRLDRRASGHVFEVPAVKAGVGVQVAALGYPLGQPLAMTRGAVTAVDRHVRVGTADRADLLQTDMPINPGNSGGPVVTIDGYVVGVVSAGTLGTRAGYAVQQPLVANAVAAWRNTAPIRTGAGCPGVAGVDVGISVQVDVSTRHPEGPTLGQVFQLYADAVNTGRYESAWQLLTPAEQRRRGPYEHFVRSVGRSYWTEVEVTGVLPLDPVTDEVTIRRRTVRDAGEGAGCTDRSERYRLTFGSGTWRIDGAEAVAGGTRPCADDAPPPVPSGPATEETGEEPGEETQ